MKKPYQIESQQAVKKLERMAAEGNPDVQLVLPMAETLGWLRKGLKWTPLSRPFFVSNKLSIRRVSVECCGTNNAAGSVAASLLFPRVVRAAVWILSPYCPPPVFLQWSSRPPGRVKFRWRPVIKTLVEALLIVEPKIAFDPRSRLRH